MGKNITIMRDYGTIRIELKSIMDERKIKVGTLANMIDTRYEVAKKWYNGKVSRIDADILARICYVLDITPDELIHYNSPKE